MIDTSLIRSPEFERPADAPLGAGSVQLPEFPLVSVVVTSFNSSTWLEAALRSALDQDWRHLEVLLVDDCSSDSSRQIALQLADGDARLRVFLMDRNVGTYAARNAGLAAARGDVLTFMDSDDYIDPVRISRQLSLLRNPGLVATTCNYERRTREGALVMNRGLPARQALVSLMFKREVLAEIGWFDGGMRFAADDEYFERIRHVYGRSAHANVPETLYVALAREGSLSTSGAAATSLDGSAEDDGLSPARRSYVAAYRRWYSALAESGMRPWMPRHLPDVRPFTAAL